MTRTTRGLVAATAVMNAATTALQMTMGVGWWGWLIIAGCAALAVWVAIARDQRDADETTSDSGTEPEAGL